MKQKKLEKLISEHAAVKDLLKCGDVLTGRGIHSTTIANNENIFFHRVRHCEKDGFHLYHCPEQLFLKFEGYIKR